MSAGSQEQFSPNGDERQKFSTTGDATGDVTGIERVNEAGCTNHTLPQTHSTYHTTFTFVYKPTLTHTQTHTYTHKKKQAPTLILSHTHTHTLFTE